MCTESFLHIGLKITKKMNPGMRTAISKKLHCERGWEEPLVKIAKKLSQWGWFFVYLMANLIIISPKKLLKTINYFKNLQNREISWQSRRLRD